MQWTNLNGSFTASFEGALKIQAHFTNLKNNEWLFNCRFYRDGQPLGCLDIKLALDGQELFDVTPKLWEEFSKRQEKEKAGKLEERQ